MISQTLKITNSIDYSEEVIKNLVDLYSKENLVAVSKERETYVVRAGDELIGTIGLIKDYLFPDCQRIISLFIKPEYQNRGIGGRLLRLGEKRSLEQDFRKSSLASSVTAYSFYVKFGYKDIEKKESPKYGPTILMIKKLK